MRTPLDELADWYNEWLKKEGLPQACAVELLHTDKVDQHQREVLTKFTDLWDVLEQGAVADRWTTVETTAPANEKLAMIAENWRELDRRFWQWSLAGRDVENVSKEIGTWYEGDPDPQPGRVYEGDLHIFTLEDGRYHLIIENREWVGSDLEKMEQELFDYGLNAGNIKM